MKKIIFTGGGSGGHVTLNLNLIPLFQENGWDVIYIGSKTGIEKDLIANIPNVKYYAIETGKLRRYFSWQNFKDALKVPVGILQAIFIIFKEKPDIIFSKGGFVSFPVVVGGFINRCKIFMHESDVTPGLANKMSLPFVNKFFTTFSDTIKYVKDKNKVKCVGPVLSDRLYNGDKIKGFKFCNFKDEKPVIMFVGGSLGAKSLNDYVNKYIDDLLNKFNVIHICGKGQLNNIKKDGYAQFEFVDKEFKDLMALTDVVVSRSGSNAIFELWSLNKPMLLVPLPSTSSRGEQSLNAKSFVEKGLAEVVKDEELFDDNKLLVLIDKIYNNKDFYLNNMKKNELKSTSNKELFEEIVNG